MRALSLVVVVFFLAACDQGPGSTGPDGGVDAGPDATPGAIGQACASAGSCMGGSAAKCEPIDECGDGFCSAVCDTASCPGGSVCVALPAIDPSTLKTTTLDRCFLPCDPAKPTCPGLTTCIPGYDVCGSWEVFTQLGTTGGHAAGGGACVTPAPDPAALPRLFGVNVAVADGNEAAAAIAPDGTWFIAYNPGALSTSSDGGANWTAAPKDDSTNIGDPAVAVDPNTGRLYFAHLSIDGQQVCAKDAAYPTGLGVNVSYSDDDGKTWGGTTQVTPAADSMGDIGVDKDWIAVLPKSGVVLISYMTGSNALTATTSSAMVARSQDHGKTFTSVELDPNMPGYRNLVQLAAARDDTVWASYWNTGDPNAFAGEVRVTESTDLGKTWAPSVAIAKGVALFDVPGLAVSPSGNEVVVTWTQASSDAPDVEDVYAAISTDGGKTFGPPAKVNSDAACATHYHPFPAVAANGDVYVLWVENRYGFGAVMWAKATVGNGATLTFSGNGFVTDATQPFTTSRINLFTGDYVGVTVSGNTLLAAWGDLRDAGGGQGSRIYEATATLP